MKHVAPLFLAGIVGLAACSDNNPMDFGDDAFAAAPAAFNTNSAAEPEFVPGQIIVRFRPGAARSEIAEANRAKHKEDMRLERMVILEVPVGEEIEIARNLSKNPNVEFAEPDFLYSVVLPCETGDCDAPDGNLFGYKWDLHNTGTTLNHLGEVLGSTGKVDADIDWLEAREHLGENFAGSAVIGILDTGIRKTHVALAGKVIGERNFITGMDPNLANDDQGHGTHVAGIAAAHGTARAPGVAYGQNIKLLSIKVCNSAGSCPSSATANGIAWAADNGANILNLSLGGGWNSATGSAAQQTALRYAQSKNVLSFCATGNDANKTGYTVGIAWPARFPECVAVGSTDWADNRAAYSNFGPGIELTAPGGTAASLPLGSSFILAATYNSNTSYGFKTGTSMATPQVAGLAALLYAAGVRDAGEILERLKRTAEDVGTAGYDQQFGYGRVNAYRALAQKEPAIEMAISSRSNVSLRSNGNMQVTLLDREAVTFSLSMIDLNTIKLGSTPLARRQNGTPFAVWSDVDGDGKQDLVLHFSVPALNLTAATTQLTLRGTITDGRTMRGTTLVRVIS